MFYFATCMNAPRDLAVAKSQLRKATAYASELTTARAPELLRIRWRRKLREMADRLAPPTSN